MRLRLFAFALACFAVLPATAQDSLDVLFRYVPGPDEAFERVYLPGVFNDWGNNDNGRIAVDDGSRMTYVDSLGSWVYPIRLRVGGAYQYKVHFHFNASGSNWDWISDPLNEVTVGVNNDSQVDITDPMVFQLARHEGAGGEIAAVSAGVFTDDPLTALTFEVNGAEQDGLPHYDPATGVLYYALPDPVPAGSQFRVRATTEGGTAEASVGLIPPMVEDAPRPAGVEDGVTYDDADPTRATLSLFAPGVPFVYLVGDFNDWTIDDAYLMKRDAAGPDSVHFWLTLEGLTPGVEYGYQYAVGGEERVADFFAEKILDETNDRFISDTLYPDLKPYPTGQTDGPVATFETGQPAYAFADFERRPQHELVIYELLIRDFLEESRLGDRSFYETLADTLGYLERLGVNAIELMPVAEFGGNDNWGYQPQFYFAPDKYYGPEEDLKAFIDAAHARGMAVILDVVYNHIDLPSPLLELYGTNDANPWINIPAHHPFNVFFDINHEDDYTQYWLDRVNEYWLTEFNVDGFRFDLSKGFTQVDYGDDVGGWSSYDPSRIALLKRMADQIWAVDSTAYVILEHFADQREEEELAEHGTDEGRAGMMLWQNMNDAYAESAMGYLNSRSNLTGVYYRNTGFDVPNRIAYMESHDEQWLMYKNIAFGNRGGGYDVRELPNALDRQKLVGAFFFTVPGPKMMWMFGELGYGYGERGEQCLRDNACPAIAPGRTARKPIRWDYAEDPLRSKLYKTWSALLNLREEHEVFRSLETDVEIRAGSGQAERRIQLSHPTMDVYIVGNFGIAPIDVPTLFQSEGTWIDYFSGDTRTAEQDDLITLLPGEFRLYTNRDIGLAEPGLITVGVADGGAELPQQPVLDQNYPNPFNPATQIRYAVPQAGPVQLAVYDALGRQVALLADGVQAAGTHQVTFDASALPSGVYVYRLTTGVRTLTRPMVLLR